MGDTNERGGYTELQQIYEKRILGGLLVKRFFSDGLPMDQDPYGTTETRERAQWKLLGFITLNVDLTPNETYGSWENWRQTYYTDEEMNQGQ